jgi:hypothetical protein
LQVPDEVPGEVQIRQGLILLDALLDEIFAKIPLPCSRGLANLVEGLFFADSEQANARRVAPGVVSGFLQQITDKL